MVHRICLLGAAALVALASAPAAAGDAVAHRLDLRDPAWELSGEDTVVEELDGRLALRLTTGGATHRGIEFLDGTIELDLQVTDHRSFAFVFFRMVSEGEHEEVYLRPHKSRLPDALQYAPVYNRRSQWQLYHDERSTAAAELPPGEWIHLELVVRGSRAALFVGDVEEPQLVATLAREPRPGYLALGSFRPLGAPEGTYLVNFANVVVRPGVVEYEFPDQAGASPPTGRIARWGLSSAFAPAEGLIAEPPPEILGGEWKTVEANVDGLVAIERHVGRPGDVRRAAVLAGLRITAAEASDRRLDLGFSDEVSVFLNGRLLVADDESYSFNLPRRQGLLTARQLSVFLPLRRGANDLVLAIADRFGGWGLTGSLEDATGLVLEPRAGAAVPASGPTGEGDPQGALARLAWLAGCWRGEAGEECWLAPRGGTMIAVNRGPEREGGQPFFELLRIVEDEAGLVLLAQPGGRSPATPFRAVELEDARVVFANPEHDFPQRITYWRDGAALKVRVEAQRDGRWQGFEQHWSPGAWPGE